MEITTHMPPTVLIPDAYNIKILLIEISFILIARTNVNNKIRYHTERKTE
jgi:hypothetical protein